MKSVYFCLLFFAMPWCAYSQELVVANTHLNILYSGIRNSVKIAKAGVPCSELLVSSSKTCPIQGTGCSFIITPVSKGICKIYAEENKKGNTKRDTFYFMVRELPKPSFRIAGKSGGEISKNVLLASNPSCELDHFDYDLLFHIKQYRVQVFQRDSCLFDGLNTGYKYGEELTNKIRMMCSGDKIVFCSILVAVENLEMIVEPVSYSIK